RRHIENFCSHMRCLNQGRGFLTGGVPRQYGPRGFGVAEIPGISWTCGCRSMGSRDPDSGSRSTDEAALSARLRRLGERLDRIGTGRANEADRAPRPKADTSGFGRGLQLSTEFVSGGLIGA